jgi:hypothetical protein
MPTRLYPGSNPDRRHCTVGQTPAVPRQCRRLVAVPRRYYQPARWAGTLPLHSPGGEDARPGSAQCPICRSSKLPLPLPSAVGDCSPVTDGTTSCKTLLAPKQEQGQAVVLRPSQGRQAPQDRFHPALDSRCELHPKLLIPGVYLLLAITLPRVRRDTDESFITACVDVPLVLEYQAGTATFAGQGRHLCRRCHTGDPPPRKTCRRGWKSARAG